MSMLKAKIAAALEKIGRTNGTAPKESQDRLDALAHEYNVASVMFSIAEKRKESAKKELIDGLSSDAATRLNKKKAAVRATEVSDRIDLGAGANYAVVAKVNNGATFLDTAALKVALMKSLGSDKTNELIESCTKRRDPSITYEVVELEDD